MVKNEKKIINSMLILFKVVSVMKDMINEQTQC